VRRRRPPVCRTLVSSAPRALSAIFNTIGGLPVPRGVGTSGGRLSAGTEVRIRRAAAADAGALADVRIPIRRAAYRGIGDPAYLERLSRELPQRTERWARHLTSGDDEATLVADTRSDGIVGFVRGGDARPPHVGARGEIGAICLRRPYRGRGLGRPLAGSLAHDLGAIGAASAVVGVLSDKPARRLCEAIGG